MERYLDRHRFVKGSSLLLRRYFEHHVGRDSAALTYYLLFALFPLLIFLSNLVGTMQLDIDRVLTQLNTIMPADVVALLRQYLSYVSAASSRTLMIFSLVFSVYFPYRAANALMVSVRKAYGMGKPTHFLRYQCKLLLCTVCFIFVLALSAAAAVLGERFLAFVSRYVPQVETLLSLWVDLRFVLLGAVLFFVIAFLYGLAQEKGRINRIWPGALLSLVMWVALSLLFSLYVESAARYNVIYGSIGAIIVLLLWLYLASVMLIMGAEFNSVLLELKEKS